MAVVSELSMLVGGLKLTVGQYYVHEKKISSTHSFRPELNITALSKVNIVLGNVARDLKVKLWLPAVKLSRE